MSFRTPARVKKTLVFSLLISVPMGICIDIIAAFNNSWFVPVTVFPFRLFGTVALEDLIWGFFFIYSPVIFYEHFLDKGKHRLSDRWVKYLAWPVIALVLIFITVYFSSPELLVIPYSYFWLGVIFFLLPSVTFLSFFPRLLSKYVKTASYFFFLALLFELTGLQLKQWTFPGGNFIGWIDLSGFRFPFEEFLFWFILGAIGILSYFEFFADDRK
ncbi:hypothetical protein A2Z33_07495 [Candidatus Gottesmanbacteria bacterium RBG_16_52_11]|uniref:Lycopene cyclase domain-containing protein n=1 Tax=Candidatus Gottesmanbacteria bacterium RBG_16_52_11 TaxID=1798374 RepID=A0A1F5YNR9_9BACT|nr:MAG: hypothetical protein A2Z33_07495 [Candidatus Gottesmanbacteria bacterium RBG_16_52_11]